VADPIPEAELRRDARVFKALKRHKLSEDERHKLFALARGPERTYTREDYRRYQARLLELAAANRHIRTAIRPGDEGQG
jgi:hypothetical protein